MTASITPEELAVIRQCLLDWRKAGVERPLMPVYRDVDGDGVPDFCGLDEHGAVVIVSGATLADSVAESTGEGIEGGQ